MKRGRAALVPAPRLRTCGQQHLDRSGATPLLSVALGSAPARVRQSMVAACAAGLQVFASAA
jgi:hypothetical protein